MRSNLSRHEVRYLNLSPELILISLSRKFMTSSANATDAICVESLTLKQEVLKGTLLPLMIKFELTASWKTVDTQQDISTASESTSFRLTVNCP